MAYGPILLSLGLMVLPRLVMASDLGALALLEPYGVAIKGTAYLVGGGLTAWRGVRVAKAYRNRDQTGMGEVIEEAAGLGAAGFVMGVIVPALVNPIIAAGAVP
jgi:hypothetical protein